MSIFCANCKNLINPGDYVWYDDTEDNYYDYECFNKLNFKNNLVCGKIIHDDKFKMIPLVAYGSGCGSSEWVIYHVNDILDNKIFCSHSKEDFYNHIPVFMQDNKFFCLDCYLNLDCKEAQSLVLLEDNISVRELYPYLYGCSNMNFDFSIDNRGSEKFDLNIKFENLKSVPIFNLNLRIFAFSNEISVDEDLIWALESPINEAHLIFYENFELGSLDKKDFLEESFTLNFPKKSLKHFDLALKKGLMNKSTLELNNYFDISESKILNVNLSELNVVVSFETHYGVFQSYERKIKMI